MGFQGWGCRRIAVPNLLFLILLGRTLIGYFESPLHFYSVGGVIFELILTADTQVTGPRNLGKSERFQCQKNEWGSSLSEVLLVLTSSSRLAFYPPSLRPIRNGKKWTKDLGQSQESLWLLLFHCEWDGRQLACKEDMYELLIRNDNCSLESRNKWS